MQAEAKLLELKQVSFAYGQSLVLKNISCAFGPSETVLILGANGAGKTTFLKACAGLLRVSGTISQSANSAYLGHLPGLYGNLSVLENLKFFAALAGKKVDFKYYLDLFDLDKYQHRPVAELSRGLQRKLGLTRALLAETETLLLDEPSSYLDHKGIEQLMQELKRRQLTGQLKLLICATHDLEHFKSSASRALLFQDGQLLLDSPAVADVLLKYQQENR